MPRYHFNVHNDIEARDEEGQELPDLEAARREAIRGVRSLAAEQVQEGRLNFDHSVEVVEGGQTVFTVTFREAIVVDG
jgi:hypothetical protein